MQVSASEGVATHTVPESCVAGCEARGEALTGVRAGQPLSRESNDLRDADAVMRAEGNTAGRVSASARPTRRGQRPWHVRTLLAREPRDLLPGPATVWPGPHREGDEP